MPPEELTTRAPPAATVGYPQDLRALIDDYLAHLRFAGEPAAAGLEEAMRYSLLAGGKRIRPVLALATARAVGRDPREVLPMGAALELIHTFSLIHDDLPAIDDDEMRRGRPTSHRRFGEDVAILAGDALFAEAFRLVLREQPGEPARVLAAVAELADVTGVNGMVGGEYIDVRNLAGAGAVGMRRLHRLKTGSLIGAAVGCVLLLFGVAEPTLVEFRAFAGELGVLFQIVDDILDVTGDEEALGKPQGSDERHGKRTYVSVFGLERARELARESHANARAALADAGGQTATLEQITDYILTRDT
jgi:geranylgeranyl diphosphate synthase type II